MLLKNLSKIILGFSLVLAFSAVDKVFADSGQVVQESKRKRCDYPYDRPNENENEERTSGGCPGTVPTPEPVSILLFSAGLAGVGFAARRRLRKSE